METAVLLAMSTLFKVVLIIFGVFAFIFILIVGRFINIWIQAWSSGARVSFISLIGMWLRKVPAQLIVRARISAVQAGITELSTSNLESVYLVRKEPADMMTCVNGLIIAYKANLELNFNELQAHHFAGGHVIELVQAMIAAHRAKIALTLDVARAIDLAGRDILDAVQTTVKPKIIDCPTQDASSGSNMLDAVAKDGIRLLVKARVTVRSNIDQLVRGATEETIIARVGQGIVSAIGSSPTYKDVLENPDRISHKVLECGLDAQTAFEIVSIDIADVSVASVRDVANVGAFLEAERAETDKQMRQAEAEGRRAMAVAREQEMRALVQENQAKVVLAEAEVPRAMAEAFRSGNMGIMDYYRMKNIKADTDMRDSIGRGGEESGKIK
ncbi:MAG: flotillin-like protein FloA [Sedimentisphaerales bacterium]|nr:flotillin-like protein FloA [Sedimentisphaerales bacterium]